VHLDRCEFEEANRLFVRFAETFEPIRDEVERILATDSRRERIAEDLLAIEDASETPVPRDGEVVERPDARTMLLGLLRVDPTFFRLDAELRMLDAESRALGAAGRSDRRDRGAPHGRRRAGRGRGPDGLDRGRSGGRAPGPRDRAHLAPRDGRPARRDARRRCARRAPRAARDRHPRDAGSPARDRVEPRRRRSRRTRSSSPRPPTRARRASRRSCAPTATSRARSTAAAPPCASASWPRSTPYTVRALEQLRARLGSSLRRARIGRIDAVMGSKRRIELQIESLSAGRFPPELLDPLRIQGLLRDDEEYWPFEGELWRDEFEEDESQQTPASQEDASQQDTPPAPREGQGEGTTDADPGGGT
jgi:hypothetical protein